MLFNKDIREHGCCLDCLNKESGGHLKKKDVNIFYYRAKCNNCGQLKHIVSSVRLLSRWKLLFCKHF